MRKAESHNTGNVWRHHFPRHHLLAACGISLAVTLMLSVLPDNVIAYRSAQPDFSTPAEPQSLPVPATLQANAAPPAPEPVELDPWLHLTVRKGDTLSSLLQKVGLSINEIHAIAASGEDARQLAALDTGDQLDILLEDGKLKELHLRKSALETISVASADGKYQTARITKTPEVRQTHATGRIDSSLFVAGQKAGLNDRMTLKLADIFAYDIDFLQDIQPGDSFTVVYETLHLDGEQIGEGEILAAEFTNLGKTLRAVRYKNQDGSVNYYTPEGNIMRKQFLRTPVDFAKITSYFSLNRKHPILHKIRAHKGIDYGAPRGTPIRSAGDGKVTFAGVRNGFGNTVMIQHGGAYTTLYAHMDKIKVKSGTRVKQGQMIGTVGSTGLATGPHLHYEFHVNGAAVNPLAHMNLAMSEPLSKAEKARFISSTAPLLSQLTQLAAESGNTTATQQLAMGNDGNRTSPQR